MHASLPSFHTQQEQTAFIGYEVEKAIARVWMKNIQAVVKYRKTRIICQQKRCFI